MHKQGLHGKSFVHGFLEYLCGNIKPVCLNDGCRGAFMTPKTQKTELTQYGRSSVTDGWL